MASLDYGCIVKKNGKILNYEKHEFSHDMKRIVGFEVDEIDGREIKDYYFNFMGDEELLVCMYKNLLSIYIPKENKIVEDLGWCIQDRFGKDCYRKIVNVNGTKIDVKRLGKGYRYRVRMWYKGDLWEALYGYGVAYKTDYWYALNRGLKNYVVDWMRDK
ncbi:hypothetical protein G6Z34_13485 [Clostridium perfringens]|uniref:Uncharacterized protein n=1 Tax=Clostridium perfringens TaxID=1502 RepID=A0AAP6WNI8_CLOPF|nr:hypothetical protein [Clostridium perfringens]NGU31098.1 hypothetical protein [Clostridium perfringens]